MTIFTIILLTILTALAITILVIILKKQTNQDLGALTERLKILAQQNSELRQSMDQKLAQTHEATQQQFGQTTKVMQEITSQSAKYLSDVTDKLTKLDQTNKQIVDFSSQLQNLQDILKNPKQRGILGEYFLEETLKNAMPPNSYQMQYQFHDGSIVDAVIFIKDKIIPVDSKFSLENYEKILNAKDAETRIRLEKIFKQDLKNRIDETSKYIKPAERTMDFAFMFIPSEAIYYDLLVNKIGAIQANTRDLIEYAFADKKVIIVSPTTFFAYLQAVLQGLRAMQIEESAKQIRFGIMKLSKHMNSYDNFLQKLGSSMSVSVNHYNTAYKEFKKIDKDVAKITDGKSEVEPLSLDKPSLE
ncbi:MAG: DNA recombination protein RmuC [bacterium]